MFRSQPGMLVLSRAWIVRHKIHVLQPLLQLQGSSKHFGIEVCLTEVQQEIKKGAELALVLGRISKTPH